MNNLRPTRTAGNEFAWMTRYRVISDSPSTSAAAATLRNFRTTSLGLVSSLIDALLIESLLG
jgi:hypothetical protein